MYLNEYISFQQKLGQRVIYIDNIPFSEYRPLFYWSLPRFTTYDVDHSKARRLLFTKALGVLYPNKDGNRSIKFCVCRGPDYNLESLHRKKRNQTRRGLERCEICRVGWERMRLEGLSINIAALGRQQRKSCRLNSRKWWDRQCRVSSQFPDVIAWGAFVQGNLTGYVHVLIHDHISEKEGQERFANIAHFMSDSAHLKCYPNEALIYTVTKKLLTFYKCAYVILGSSSDDRQLLSWKRHMGFTEVSVPYTIMVNPILRLAKCLTPKLKTYLSG